jgi:hypothetical protein
MKHLETRREMGQVGLHFYLSISQHVSATLKARSLILFQHFPKGLQYTLGTSQNISYSLKARFPVYLNINGHFFFIFLKVPCSHLYLQKIKQFKKPSVVLPLFLLSPIIPLLAKLKFFRWPMVMDMLV